MAKSKVNPMDKFIDKTSDVIQAPFVTEQLIKSELIILPELRDLIPPLAEDESKQLEENILKYGIKDPLSVWETTAVEVLSGLDADSESHELFIDYDNDATVYILFDGHNRYGIAKDKALDFKINKMSFAGISDVKDYMINYQLGRRNLTPEQISYLRGLRYNQLKQAGKGQSVKTKANVAAQLAEEYNVSPRTVIREGEYAEGMDKLSPELKKDVLSGKTKIAKQEVKALKSAKVDVPIDSMEGVRQLLKEQEEFEDKEADEKVDSIVDSIFGNNSESNSATFGNTDDDTNTEVESIVDKDLFEKIDLNDFKDDDQTNEPEILSNVDTDDEENVHPEVAPVSPEELEVSLRELVTGNLTKDVLIEIINKAGDLLSYKS